MTLDEIITNARTRAFDTVKPKPFCTDEEWTGFANDAQYEACRRARLIVDSTSPLTLIAIAANKNSYPLDPRILFIRRAKLASRAQPLTPVHIAHLDERFLGWESDTGEPRHFIKDMDTRAIRLYPQSTVADSLRLTVTRLPLEKMLKGSDCPEIRPHLHESLIFWMLYRFYSKQDAETEDEKKAADNLGFFEAEFGKKSSAIDEAWIERNHGYMADGIY